MASEVPPQNLDEYFALIPSRYTSRAPIPACPKILITDQPSEAGPPPPRAIPSSFVLLRRSTGCREPAHCFSNSGFCDPLYPTSRRMCGISARSLFSYHKIPTLPLLHDALEAPEAVAHSVKR
ncbi:hypothetical protein CC2G_003013 [Coprinopsis cinerea AmutBmut pab1-1]|nr:hypothetical protein CC2G_003013 [Coprinopsis cinerea AmutBmut pab1-1]